MRNLKRALSLTLASVMLLGMMVVGAGAAGYKDVTDGHNVEAIEVLQAVGAMVGDEAGNFDPDANVNRAQIATIMSRLLDLKVEDFNAADIPFTDVPEWAVPFVAACYADGITSGVSATAYGSNNSVTAAQAALMMMKALGYFQYQDDFGQDWQLATIKQASEIGLFNGITVDRTSALTRNDVAQMALNALKSNMVSFTGDVGSTYTVNGETIRVGYKPEYTVKTSADPIYNRIDNLATTIDKPTGQYEMQLGEYLYGGDLRLEFGIDMFGRPSRNWEFDGDDIGTYVREELLRESYTAGVTGKTVFDLLSRSIINDSELFVYVDGVTCGKGYDNDSALTHVVKNDLVSSNQDNLGHTGRGVLTQVFYDSTEKEITISMINTYLAQATTDYSEKTGTISMVVYDGVYSTEYTKSAKVEDVPEVEGLAAEDWFLVYMSGMDSATLNVVDVFDVNIMSDVEATRFETKNEDKDGNYKDHEGKDRISAVTVDGTKYSTSKTQWFNEDVLDVYNDNRLVDKTYDLYLDQYGYVIGVDLHSGEAQYVFIAAYDINGSNIGNRTADALAIFPDGTIDNIDVNVKATNKNIENAYDGKDLAGVEVANGVYHTWQDNPYTHVYGKIFNEKINLNGNVENLWYSYSVNTNGVYTLSPAKDFTIEINNEDKEDFIQTDRVSLQKSPAATVGTDKKYVSGNFGTVRSYGNDDSVYLTVDTDTTNTYRNPVIDDVNGRYTGVQDVKLVYQPFGKTADDGVYDGGWVNAVVNSKGYVVAAVVMGEAEGVSDNYAYIKSGAYAEEKVGSDHFWDVDVIRDGTIQTMKIKNNYEDTVQNLKVNRVQELVLDTEGNIIRVRDVENEDSKYHDGVVPSDNYHESTKGGNKVYDYHEYNWVTKPENNDKGVEMDGFDVYYIETAETVNNYKGENSNISDISLVGRTLYLEEENDFTGLAIASGAKAVLRQRVNNKTTWTEYADVASAYRNVADALEGVSGKQFKGHIAAVLNGSGAAEWVVFYDETPVGTTDPGYGDHTGPVFFESTKTVFNSGKTIEVVEAWTRANKYGVGHIYFELDAYPNTSDIIDDDGVIPIVYNVYVNGTRSSDRVLHNQSGDLVLMKDGSGNYKFELDTKVDFFNEEDEIYLGIVRLDIQYKFPVAIDPNLGTSLTVAVDGVGVGDDISGALGHEANVVITNKTTTRAAGEKVTTIEAGKTYWVEFNNNKDAADKVTANDKGELRFTHTINAVDVKAGKLELTAIYADVETPDEKEPISSVTVTGLPATIKDGDTFTVTVSTANVTGSVDVTAKAPTTEITLEITTTHEAGFAKDLAVEGWTVVVAEDGKSATLTKTVDVEPAGTVESDITVTPDYTQDPVAFKVSYTGEKPSLDAVKDAINAQLEKDGKELVADSVSNANKVYDASNAIIGVVTYEGTYALYVNGTKIEGVELKNTASGSQSVKLPAGTGAEKLIAKGTKDTNPIEVNTTAAGSTISIPQSTLTALEGDLYLVNGYKLVTDATVTGSAVKYTLPGASEQKADGADNDYFPDGTQFVFVGTLTNGTGSTSITLTVGEHKDTKPAAAEALEWEVTFDAESMLNDSGVIAPKETAVTETTLKIGNKTWTLTGDVGSTMTLDYRKGMPENGAYVIVTDAKNWAADAKQVEIVANSADADKKDIKFKDDPTPVDGVIELTPAVKVVAKDGVKELNTGVDTNAQSGAAGSDTTYWIAADAVLTFDFGTPAETDRPFVKSGTEKLSVSKNGNYFTFDLSSLTAAQLTAGVEIDREVAVATITYTAPAKINDKTQEDAITGAFGNPTDATVAVDNFADLAGVANGETYTLNITITAGAGHYFPSNYKITGFAGDVKVATDGSKVTFTLTGTAAA